MDVSLEFMGFIVIHRDLAKKHGNIHPPTHLNLGDPNTHGYGLNHWLFMGVTLAGWLKMQKVFFRVTIPQFNIDPEKDTFLMEVRIS